MTSDGASPCSAIVVLHILPSLTVGGIETMMTRFAAYCPAEIDYRLLVLSTENATQIALPEAMRSRIQYLGINLSPITYLRAACMLIEHEDAIIVSSTWKAALVVLLAKRFCTVARHIAFTHRSSAAHHIDGILRTWQVRHSLLNLADSQSSAQWVRRAAGRSDVTVIDPVFPPPIKSLPKAQDLTICFIGRLAPVKNLETVFKLVEGLAAQGLSLSFHIYGPDAGRKHLVDQWIEKNQLDRFYAKLSVAYLGPLTPQQVHQTAARYHFIVSCSHTEGFAMSIAEAMQVGTVPIVGKIGGPATYCRPDNSIVLDDYTEASIESAVIKVREIWHQPSRYCAMSESARQTFTADQFFPSRYAALLKQVSTKTIFTQENPC